LASLIGQRQFELWFRQKTRLVVDEDELVVYAASPFHQKWLQKQHRLPLVQAARTVLGASARVRFEVDATLSAAAASPGTALIVKTEMPMIVANRALRVTPPADAPVPAVSRPGRRFADLGDFVIGPCNELALTAVRQGTDRPDGTAGALLIYGPVGMGKTHLLEGVYREGRRENPALAVLFLTPEPFTNQVTQ